MLPGSSRSRTSAFVLSVVFYTAAFAILSWPWLSGAVTIPWDAKAQFQPELQFLASSLARGESPFWTPNLFAGWPQIADPQSLIFSPLHFALAAFDPTPSFRAVDFVTFAYLFAGGLGLMLFFRDRGWHPVGAATAALIFAFGGSASSRLQHTGEIISLSYVPIALWLLARTLDHTSWRIGLAAGVIIALLIIGRDQVALIGLYVLALFVLAWWLDGKGRLARIRSTVLPLAACAATVAVIAVVPVVLAALLAAASNRPTVGLEAAGRGSLHPALLLMLVVSDLFGAADPNVVFWGPPSPGWREKMTPTGLFLAQNVGEIYCGILAMILLFGTGLARGLLWTREIRFFAVMLAVVLLYALGWYTPAFRLMYELLPGVDLFRRPADATFIIGLLLAINTGYLVHRLLAGTAPAPRWWVAVESALMAIPIAIAVAVAHEAGKRDRARRSDAPLCGGASCRGSHSALRLHRLRPCLEQCAERIDRPAAVALRGAAAGWQRRNGVAPQGKACRGLRRRPPRPRRADRHRLSLARRRTRSRVRPPVRAQPAPPPRLCACDRRRRYRGDAAAARLRAAVPVLPLHHGRSVRRALHRERRPGRTDRYLASRRRPQVCCPHQGRLCVRKSAGPAPGDGRAGLSNRRFRRPPPQWLARYRS